MKHLQGLNVLILGLGDSGLAMARWCARCGVAGLQVADTREAPPQAAVLREQLPQARLHTGALDLALLDGIQLLLKSPGLSPLDAQLAPLLARADELGIPVRGELSLFASALADLKAERQYTPKVIAITGTNGKTTTTSLTAQLVERCGLRVGLAGNIGPTLLDTLGAALDLEPAPPAESSELASAQDGLAPAVGEEAAGLEAGDPDDEALADLRALDGVDDAVAEADAEAGLSGKDADPATGDALLPEAAATASEDDTPTDIGGGPPPHLIPPAPPGPVFEHLPQAWVLELSSFQLDGVTNFEPHAATVLNLSQDHLDWHGNMEAYAQAKGRIFGKTAVLVVNVDDAQVMALVPAPVAGKGRMAKPVPRETVRFGLQAPTRPGDFGLAVEGGMAWLVRALPQEAGIKRKKGEVDELVVQRLMPADALRIRGRHNAANALAALALATAIGCPLAPMLHGLRDYAGEPHRVEFIGTVQGVDAYDDSKGTNVGATVAAIHGLGEDRAPAKLVVILGGDGKGQDFTPLQVPVQRHARAVALIGRDAAAIEAVLASSGVVQQRFEQLEQATRWCFERAHEGDSVLLSPACASLDMFRNYAHRAQVFVDSVQALAAERGEALS
jgi:UDP-N-acetylmuramoylalanine--D-glutamate ligase